MAYYIPDFNGSFTAAIVDNRHIDGSQGSSLAVWSAADEGRARTRIRSILMRERVSLAEIEAPEGGAVFVMPMRYANATFWRDFIDNPVRHGVSLDLYETDKLEGALSRLEAASGFQIKEPEVVGRNRYGYAVYDRTFGRTAHKIGDHRDIVPEWNRKDGQVYGEKHPEMFFRARSEFDLAENARSVFIQMANGEKLNEAEIDRLSAALSTPDYQVRPRELMEHVEAEISRCIATGEVEGRDGLDGLMACFPRERERTSATIINQQYSTPYPFGLAASEIFGDVAGKTVLEPTIGNGALGASFAARGAEVSGYEIDHGRFLRATRALGEGAGVIEHADFLSAARNIGAQSYDFVAANPPFGGLPAQMDIPVASSRFTTDRLHYAIAVEAIQRLKVGGGAFLVLPADIYNPEEKGSTARRFHNLMKLAFDRVEEAVADGRLYHGMGTSVPVQLYAAHGFRADLHSFGVLKDPEFMGTPRTLKSYGDLYEWADECRERFGFPALDAGWVPSEEPPEADLEPEPTDVPQPQEPTPAPEPPADAPRQEQDAPSAPRARQPEQGSRQGTPATGRGPPRGAERQEPVLKDDPLPHWLTDSLASDENQPYLPFSRAGAATSMIPRSLSGAVYGALEALDAKLKAENGRDYDIDAYVADALRIPKAELLKGERLSPEQVDGVGLTLSGMAEGRGILIGDLMGLGKGREQGAILESSLAEGDPVMFVTVKPALFSDFLVRDLADVSLRATEDRLESGEMRVHLINANSLLMDRDERVIYRQKGKKGYDIPADANVVATTYSQFQKAETGVLRLEAVKAWMASHFAEGRKPRLLLDEAHKAASPDSNTGAYFSQLCRFVEENGGSVIWSSATGIKTGQHIDLYYSALPDTGLGKQELLDIMTSSDALSLQEALSHEMAASGSLFVRQLADQGIERDLPRLVDYDPDKTMRVRDKVDAATEVLRDIIEFIPRIKDAAGSIARDEFGGSVMRNGVDKLKLDTNSPVTNVHHFSGYLTLATKGQFIEELVTDSLARGEKQVFTVEHLGASILQWKMAQPGELLKDGQGGRYFLTPPNLGDALKRYVTDAVRVSATDAIGNKLEVDLSDELAGWIAGMKAQIDEADLADMRCDGADMIRAALDKMGLHCGELTGRTTSGGMGVTGDMDGRFYLYEFEKGGPAAATQVANRFNNGEFDAVVLNKSSSAGISLQAAKSVGDDLRRRCMLKFELLSDIVDERQIEGRVNRKGQVEGPRYVAPLTGFASDDRLASLFNRKNRSLSASTNATRESSTTIDEVVDLLNPVGRQIVYDYLLRNPDLAMGLDINVGDELAADDTLTRKLLGRLIVRPLEEQTRVLGEIDVLYRMRSEFLDRRGLNPNKNNRRDWRGLVVDQEVLLSENRATGIAAQPVYLTTIEAPTTVEPISYDDAVKKVKRGLANAQLQGDLTENMGKAFDENGKPKFQGRPWLKAVSVMDRSHFASGESRDVNKMAEELAKFYFTYGHNNYEAAKLKEDADLAKLEVVRNAQFLLNLSSSVAVGRAVFLNPELVPELGDTRLAAELRMLDDDAEGWIPAVISAYSGSGAYPLNPDYHFFEALVPGEAAPIKVKIGNLARHLQTMAGEGQNWAETRVAVPMGTFLRVSAHRRDPAFQAIENWLVPHGENAGMFRRAEPEDFSAEQAEAKKAFTQVPKQDDLIRALFDRTVAGEIMTQKTVLTGNMFRSLLLTRQKNGQSAGTKIIFSDSKGVWHHGIEVGGGPKNEKLRRIRDKAQVTASSSPTIQTPEQLGKLFSLAMEQDTAQPFAQAHRGLPQPPSPLVRASEIYGSIGGVSMADKIREEGMPPIADTWLAPPCAFVGPDIFSEKLLENRNGVYKGLVQTAGVLVRQASSSNPDRALVGSYAFSEAHLKGALASAFKEIKRGEMYYFPLRGGASVLFNPKNKTLQSEFPDLVERASNKGAVLLDNQLYAAPTGTVGVFVPWAYDSEGELQGSSRALHERICQALMRVGEANEQPVLLTGTLRMISERLDAVSFGLQREAGLKISAPTMEENQEVTHRSYRSPRMRA